LVDVKINQLGGGNCVYRGKNVCVCVCECVIVVVTVVVIVVFNNNAVSEVACKDEVWLYRMGHEKVARLPFCTYPCYCINFCTYAMLRNRATFSWPTLYLSRCWNIKCSLSFYKSTGQM
jgi:hypothetical protein